MIWTCPACAQTETIALEDLDDTGALDTLPEDHEYSDCTICERTGQLCDPLAWSSGDALVCVQCASDHL